MAQTRKMLRLENDEVNALTHYYANQCGNGFNRYYTGQVYQKGTCNDRINI